MAVLYESKNTSDAGNSSIILGNQWLSTSFTPQLSHRITSVKLRLLRLGGLIGGTITLGIRATDAVTHKPTGSDLCSGTFPADSVGTSSTLCEFTFTSPVVLNAGSLYAIVLRRNNGDGSHYTFWRYSGGTAYGYGYTSDSNDGGSTWSTPSGSPTRWFEEWGDDIACTTQAATAMLQDQATGNGTISAGATGIDQVGFDYALYGSAYNLSVVSAVGSYGPGAFSLAMTGLTPVTWYWCRAKIHHTTYGWLYGGYYSRGDAAFQSAHDTSLVKYEYSTPTPNTDNSLVYLTYQGAMTFTPLISHSCQALRLKLRRYAYAIQGGYTTISLHATDGAGKPTGVALVSATIPTDQIASAEAVYEFGLGAGVVLTAALKYAIVVKAAGCGVNYRIILRGVNSSPYAGGGTGQSTDNGVTWNMGTPDSYFEEWGESGVETYPADNLESFSATGNGYIEDNTSITQIGFEWGTTQGGPYPYSVTYTPAYVGVGPFYLELTGLSAETEYFYRAKCYHTVYGWLYGNEYSFTTTPPDPRVRTDPPSSASFSPPIIDAVGYITDIGAENADWRGFVYGLVSVSTNPGNVAPEDSGYEDVKKETGSFGVGSFTLQLRNLNAGKVYYIRAYAHNSYGYNYGSEVRALVSDTVNLLYPNSDASKGIRFDTSPGGGYPVGAGTIPHYVLITSKDTTFTYPAWTRWGWLSGKFVYEYNAYNDDYYTDLYGLFNPIIRTAGCIKIKWKSRLFKSGYPFGKFKRAIKTYGTQYDGTAYDILPSGGLDVCEIFYTNPNTGLGWTVTELDALQAGVTLGKEGGFGMACCDWVEVVAIWHNAEATTDPSIMFTGPACRLMGHVTEDEGDACVVYFEYGPTTGYGSVTADQTKSRGDVFYADVTGADLTGYHYRAVIETPCGETFYGADMTMDYDYGALMLEQAYSVASVRQSIFTVAPTWTDITQYLMKLHIKRGRLHELDKCEASTAVFTLNNATGNFYRDNTAGTYYPDIQPLTLTRLRYRYAGVYYPLWYGVSESYKPGWVVEAQAGFTPVMTMGCVDVFKSLTRYKLTDANPAITSGGALGAYSVVVGSVANLHVGQDMLIYTGTLTAPTNSQVNTIISINTVTLTVTFMDVFAHSYSGGHIKKFPSVLSGRRIMDCLLELGWPLALSSLDYGQCYVIMHTPPTAGTNIMEHLYAIAEAECGLIFMAANGWFMFQDSLARTKAVTAPPYQATNALTTSQATFKDDDTDSKYAHPELADDDTFIYNQADIAGEGITEQIVKDDDLQPEQGPRSIDRKDSQLFDSDDAFNQAYTFVEKFRASALRCDSLLIKPQAAPTNLYPIVLGSEISTRLTFNLNTATNPAMVTSRQYHVEGQEHSWEARTNLWTTKLQLWNVAKIYTCKATHDGYIGHFGATDDDYITVHDEPQGDAIRLFNDSATPLQVGQNPYIGFYETYGIRRAVIEFDLTALDPSWTISKVRLAVRLTGTSALHDKTDFDLTVVKATLVTSMPITIDTYGDLLPMLVSLGSVTVVGGEVTGPCFAPYIAFIELNATGIAYVQAAAGGLLRLALRSDHDMSATPPINDTAGWDEYVFIDSKAGGFKPRLFVVLE